MTREEYIPKLNKLLEKWLDQEYTKNSREMYDRLERWQEDAIANAKRLLNIYNPPRPEQDRPSTTVHLLVEELRKYIR